MLQGPHTSQTGRQAPVTSAGHPRPVPLPLPLFLLLPQFCGGGKRGPEGLYSVQYWQKVVAVCGASITVYLIQLVVAVGACLFLLLVFTPAFVQHSVHYAGHLHDPRLLGATACLPAELIPLNSITACQSLLLQLTGQEWDRLDAVEGLAYEGGEFAASECLVQHREDCPLPVSSLAADLFITIFLALCLFATLLLTAQGGDQCQHQHQTCRSQCRSQQGRLERRLGVVALPTARDFTVEVQNPPAGAIDLSEWFQFFNKHFGKVQNVTITYANKPLVEMLLEKRRLLRYYSVEDIATKQLMDKSELSLDEERLWRYTSSMRVRCSPCRLAMRLLRFLCLLSPRAAQTTAEEEATRRDITQMNALCGVNKSILSLISDTAIPQPQSVYVTFEQQSHRQKCLSSEKLFRAKHALIIRR